MYCLFFLFLATVNSKLETLICLASSRQLHDVVNFRVLLVFFAFFFLEIREMTYWRSQLFCVRAASLSTDRPLDLGRRAVRSGIRYGVDIMQRADACFPFWLSHSGLYCGG
jgi:hypothetical protein